MGNPNEKLHAEQEKHTPPRDEGATERQASRVAPPHELPRSATSMAPGIPAGSGEGIERALEQPDSDLGGGVAGDTTPRADRERRGGREPKTVRAEDKERTTL